MKISLPRASGQDYPQNLFNCIKRENFPECLCWVFPGKPILYNWADYFRQRRYDSCPPHRENQSAEAAAAANNTVCKPRRPAGSFFVSEFAPISFTKPFWKERCCLDSSILFGKVLRGWLAQFQNKVIPQCRYGRRLGLISEGSQSSTCCL